MNTLTTDVYHLIARDTIENGGGTYARDVFRPAVLPHRYVVAIGEPYARKVPATLGASAFPALVKSLRELSDARGVWQPTFGLGTWVSEGTAHVDIVESFPDREHALQTARTRQQEAIWDSVDNVEITVV